MPTTWYHGVVEKIHDETLNTKRFWVSVSDVDSFDFRAGQFVTFDLPIGEKRLQRWRSYSIASAPDGGNVLEFCIVRLEGGHGTRYFFEDVTIGTSLKFKGPDGNFCLPEIIQTDLVMICTGTGIAPFRSMLQQIFAERQNYKKIHLIFGCRQKSDILYQEEFMQLAAQYPDFQYDVTLSRESTDSASLSGYVHQVYLMAYAKKREDVVFYLCGWSKMIDEAVANLHQKLGFAREQIKYELYG